MIHYFNPGNETAILNGSQYYQPASNLVKMQKDLAFLPAWYSHVDDFVLTDNELPESFSKKLKLFDPIAQPIKQSDVITKKSLWHNKEIDLWGIAPNSIYLFEKINITHQLDLRIPSWNEKYKELCSRSSSYKVLEELVKKMPEIDSNILPFYFNNLNELENFLSIHNNKLLIKSPYSSSGRGLVWLTTGKLAQSETQIIRGMLKKQGIIFAENILDKVLDFSMHFNVNNAQIDFLGYSLFETNSKGAYEKSVLSSQENLEKRITSLIEKYLTDKVKIYLSSILKENYSPYYVGKIGIDMMVYKTEKGYKLNPCIEINMRKSMGYLALKLYEKHIHPRSEGYFFIEYNSSGKENYQRHIEYEKTNPLVVQNKRITSGYFPLCPVSESTNFLSYIIIKG